MSALEAIEWRLFLILTFAAQQCWRVPQPALHVGPAVSDESGEQYRRIDDATSMPDWIEDRTVPGWVKDRYQWDNSEAGLRDKGYVLCSVVKEIRGKFPGKHYHNIIEIPEFGKIFLGELVVDYGSFQLIMVRMELGSPTEACVSAAVGKANGSGGGG